MTRHRQGQLNFRSRLMGISSVAAVGMGLLGCAGGGGTSPDASQSNDQSADQAGDQGGKQDGVATSDTASIARNDSSAEAGSDVGTDGSARPPQPRPSRQWTPQYPGQVFGCSSQDDNDPTSYQCFLRVYPAEPVVPLGSACDEGETPHEDTCPSTTYSGPAIATCQELPTPKPTAENPSFAPFFAYVIYESELLTMAKSSPDPVAKCKELVANFPDPFCPPDAVLEYNNPQIVDCSVLAKK